MDSPGEDEAPVTPVPKRAKRSRSWTDDETRSLIEAWKKYASMGQSMTTKARFLDKLHGFMCQQGFTSWEPWQIDRRMENLKKEYRVKMNPGTGAAGGEWKWRKELYDVLQGDYYNPDARKFRETPAPVSTPADTPITTNSSDKTDASSVNETTPESFRSRKASSERREARASSRRLDLLEKHVEVQTALLNEAKKMNANTELLIELLREKRSQPQASLAHAPQQPVTCGNCGLCNVCTNGENVTDTGFFPSDYTSSFTDDAAHY